MRPSLPHGLLHEIENLFTGDLATLLDLRKYDDVQATYEKRDDGTFRAVAIDAARPLKHDRWAIVIGVQNYDDKSFVRDSHAVEDARQFKETLLKRYAFAPERLILLLDPTRRSLEENIKPILENALGPTQVVVYISTQGFPHTDGQAYLAARDFDPKRAADTGLSLKWVAEQLEKCASANKLLLLDCCPPKPLSDSERPLAASQMLESLKLSGSASAIKGTSAIAGCQPGEQRQESPDKKHGLFAWYLAQGYSGAADQNRDLQITATELFDFLKQNMANSPQTPVLFLSQ